MTLSQRCIDPGDTTDVIALVQGVKEQRVIWEPPERVFGSGESGTISDSGLFRAPDSPGLIRITATSVVDETAKGEEIVKVGGCDCWWSVSIEGRTIFGIAGKDRAGFVVQSGNLIAAGFDQLEGGIFQMFPADPGGVPVIPGVYPFFVSGNIGLTPPDFLYTSQEEPQLQGNLVEFTPTLLEAHISGPIVILTSNPGDPKMPVVERQAQIKVRFRVLADPQFPLAPTCFVE